MTNNKAENNRFPHNFFLFFYSLIIFIIIIKFGAPVGLSEISFFPMNLPEWIIFSWSPLLFTSVSSLLLLFTLFYILLKKEKPGSYKFQIPGLWILFTLFSLLGFKHASCLDIPYMYCFYFAGITAISISIYYLKKLYTPELLNKYLLGAVFWATLFIVLYGLYQYLYGFKETRAYVFSMNTNVTGSGNFYTRLMQNYIFSTFSLTNTLAGFLILTIPISVWYSFKYTRTKILKYFFPFLVFVFSFTVLFLTGSRSAVLSFSITIPIVFITTPSSIKSKIAAIIFSFSTIITGIFYLSTKGAASASLLVRLDYYIVALKLFIKNIFTGSGWGNFFYYYGFMKTYPSPEASHTPHNFILTVASQSGIIPATLIIIIFILPIIILYKKLYRNKFNIIKDINFYLLIGLFSLLLHMLLDVDFQVPAIITTAVIFSILAITDDSIKQNIKKNHNKILIMKNRIIFIITLLLIILLLTISINRIPVEYKLQKLHSICFPMFYDKTQPIDIEKKRDDISSLLLDISKSEKYSPRPWAIAGKYCLRNRNWADAEFCFTNAILRSPYKASYYYNLFISQAYQKKNSEALKNLKKAKQLFPNLYGAEYNKFNNKLKEVGYVQ